VNDRVLLEHELVFTIFPQTLQECRKVSPSLGQWSLVDPLRSAVVRQQSRTISSARLHETILNPVPFYFY
jgi:hypothetical protein